MTRLYPWAALAALLLATSCATTPEVVKPPVEEPMTKLEVEKPSIPQELIDKSGVEEFDVDGLQVILKQTPGKPVVAANLSIRGGLPTLTAQTIGIESLALSVATQGGTTTTPREAFKQKLDSMGSAIGGGAGRESSTVSMRSILPYFEDTWGLFAQVLTEPAFDEQQLKLDRSRTIENLRSREDSADQYLSTFASESYFADHPYGWQTDGTIETVTGFTREQLQAHYKGLMTRERLLLTVVGDISKDKLTSLIKKDLAGIPSQAWEPVAIPPKSHDKPAVAVKSKADVATNYVLGYYSAPGPQDPDYYPLLVATNYLSDRLFEEVRTKRNLTYAVSAGMGSRPVNIGYLYTTAVKPNEVVRVMFQEIKALQTEPLTKKNFDDLINVFLTEKLMGQETNAAQAGTLAGSELKGGGWEESLVFLDRIRAVTPEDVLRVAQKYMQNIQWAYIGKPEALDQAFFQTQPADVTAPAAAPAAAPAGK